MGRAKGVAERRNGIAGMVEKLQGGRTQMLVLFCRLAGVEPYSDRANDRGGVLQEFCQALVDYVASGHFLIYERIANGLERRRSVADAATTLYPRIRECTDEALSFNDKYDCEDHCSNFDALAQDLSRLGEVLAERIELEDSLLRRMLER